MTMKGKTIRPETINADKRSESVRVKARDSIQTYVEGTRFTLVLTVREKIRFFFPGIGLIRYLIWKTDQD